MASPQISYELATAYDMFVSLAVLHDPTSYGVRGVWAAGMRSRLPNAEREFLESVVNKIFWLPVNWIYNLPPPKDAATVLRGLEKTAPTDRLLALVASEWKSSKHEDNEAERLLVEVKERGTYTDKDVQALHEQNQKMHGKKIPRKEVENQLRWWAESEAFGEEITRALRTYYEVFFAEEERRIYPALQDALEQAQELGEELQVEKLVEELSQGVTFTYPLDMKKLILAPSYWIAPLITMHQLGEKEWIFLFGARPDDASLVPGEVVPDSLLRALKALSDPTRLKIMYYLSEESLTPTQLSHRLRLRAPTVVHHLQNLRVAGLVQVNISEGKERSYGLRRGAVLSTCESLRRFLGIDIDFDAEAGGED